jgi:hypothetical protein
MNILIPINEEKKLCPLKSNSSWAVVTLDVGKTKNINFYTKEEKIESFSVYIVVVNKNEPINDFLLEGIGVLIAPMQKEIEDIIEAYMFRELHEFQS